MLKFLKKTAATLLIFVFVLTEAAGVPPAAGEPTAGNVSAAFLTEINSGSVLFEKSAGQKLPAAGLSRLPALLVICEAFDASEIGRDALVTVDDKAAKIGGTTAFLRAGEQIDAASLLLAVVMINAGDATHALACAACGSEAAAVERINSRLAELGVECTYADICGAGQLFSANELAAIGAALIKSDTYRGLGTKYYETIRHNGAGDTELVNPNKLVKQYSGCIGVGTGSSGDAGYCGVFAAQRGETVMLAVVLGAANSGERFSLASALLDNGFSAHKNIRICSAGERFGTVPVKGSMKTEVSAEAAEELELLLSGAGERCKTETELPEYAEAPILAGDILGRLKVLSSSGEVIAEVPLAAAEDAPAAGFGDCFSYILRLFLRR